MIPSANPRSPFPQRAARLHAGCRARGDRQPTGDAGQFCRDSGFSRRLLEDPTPPGCDGPGVVKSHTEVRPRPHHPCFQNCINFLETFFHRGNVPRAGTEVQRAEVYEPHRRADLADPPLRGSAHIVHRVWCPTAKRALPKADLMLR